MDAWMLDAVLVGLAGLFMAYVVYKLAFSSDEMQRREINLAPRPRFERREVERPDRRREALSPPNGVDRRVGARR